LIRPGKSKALPVQKFTFPAPGTLVRMQGTWSVYLTWIALRFVTLERPKAPTATSLPSLRQTSATLMCFSLYDVNTRANPLSG